MNVGNLDTEKWSVPAEMRAWQFYVRRERYVRVDAVDFY